ncbi:hypothetical protein ATK78_1348 [Pedobacter metabolipauper]|uniref:DUF7448 domain-containing protein n=2 Tax=Pedobacter metabolipauper TaxID=425513 RepID=A0A4R6SZW5_9SPHI|nr:hypothetical protein ATK78_1348 [Pedobacter metabolipauper]
MGVMLNLLGGNEKTVNCLKASIGKIIKLATLDEANDRLVLEFTDETKLFISDEGQSCCEHRYMTTDDNLVDFAGAVVLNYQIKDAPSIEDEYGDCHDIEWFEVITDKGPFQMVNHNEHNGYYGGFSVCAKN